MEAGKFYSISVHSPFSLSPINIGTGSGSFSHATSRTIGTEGRLYSYEFHEGRAAKAQEDFTRHGINNITLTHRNVCKDGFDIKDIADAGKCSLDG